MILVLDAGNSRLKWARSEPDAWVAGASLEWSAARVDAPPEQWQAMATPERVVGGSVAGAAAGRQIAQWTRTLWGLEPEWLRSTAEAQGLRNPYREPARLGIDRWAALVSAHCEGVAPACVVDCGSALTVDLLGRDGRHRGGWIVPGRRMMMQALLAGTADVDIPQRAPSAVSGPSFGEDTVEAVEGGMRAALLGVIERALLTADRMCGESVACLLTGGDGEWLRSGVSRECRLVPDLVLRGLARLAGVYPGESIR